MHNGHMTHNGHMMHITESDRDLNYNDADILTNEQMDQIINAESDTEFAEFE